MYSWLLYWQIFGNISPSWHLIDTKKMWYQDSVILNLNCDIRFKGLKNIWENI